MLATARSSCFILSLLFVTLTMDNLSEINLTDGWMDTRTSADAEAARNEAPLDAILRDEFDEFRRRFPALPVAVGAHRWYIIRFAECDFLLVFYIHLTCIACTVSEITAAEVQTPLFPHTTGFPQQNSGSWNITIVRICSLSEFKNSKLPRKLEMVA